jgi:hypothetical protein
VNANLTTTEGSGGRKPRTAIGRVSRGAMGERLAGYIYGTIVVLSVDVAGAKAYPHSPGHVAVLVLVTTGVFWLAHVYAHALAESVARDRRVGLHELLHIAHRESSMVEAALPAVVLLLLGELGVISEQTAVWAAIAAGFVVLAAQGIVFARMERLGALATFAVVAVNLALGFALVALKLFVSH